MKTFQSTVTAGMTAIVFAALFAGAANANCNVAKPGYLQASHRGMPALSIKQPAPALVPQDTAPAAVEPSIAGYWYVRFFAEGQLVDDGFDLWHGDGTEVLNDTSTPSSGNVCIGVWTKAAPLTYALKHPTWIFDDAGVNLIGVGIIREMVMLDPGGNSFTGTTTVDIYDFSGNTVYHAVSDLTGTRISATDDQAAYPSPIPGLPASIVNR
ncbi:exported hypothetical protein [Candidatus Sulfopaludibacter sp. SbA3]|nr:exported hypothetical protein [Candidatus Sulfopaludibacter sp. SbA3]